jgi:peptidoglycan/xylan/chitin deacetylase (PgdA/CDA1 family)
VVHVTFDDAFASTGRLMAHLAGRDIVSTVFVCTDLADRSGAPLVVTTELEDESRRYPNELATLSWAELTELSSDMNVEIGSHTVTHARLWELSDSELAEELRESKSSIEDHIGRPCRYLAYPFGCADERVVRAAEQAGYEAAFLLLNGRWSHRYALPRVDLYPRDRGVRLLVKSEPTLALPIARLWPRKRRLAASRRLQPEDFVADAGGQGLDEGALPGRAGTPVAEGQ